MTDTARGNEPELPPAERLQAPRGRDAWVRVVIPTAGVLAGVVALVLLLEPGLRRDVFSFLAFYMLPGGIDYGIPIARAMGLAPWQIVALITFFDLWITLFWVWNLDHLARWAWVRGRINKSRARANQLWERFPRLRVATGPGLTLFILLPIPWTGSFGGIVIGKLLDLRDWVIYVASITGTLLRVTLFALFWDQVIGFF